MIKTAFELRTIGDLLKERRKEKGLTIEQVAEITKIRSIYIKALENSDHQAFSSEVYLKGFLRNYSHFLEIGTERALAMYRRESEFKSKEPVIKLAEKIKESGFKLDFTTGKIISLIIVAIVLVTIGYIGFYINNILKQPTLLIKAPISISAGAEGVYKTNDDQILVTGNTDIGTTLTINGQKFETNNFEEFRKELAINDGLNTFIFSAESQFGKKSTLTLNVLKQSSTPQTTPQTTSVPLVMHILIEVDDREAYFDAFVDGENKAGKVYQPKSSLELDALTSFEFFTPRPDTIKLFINDEQQTIDAIKSYKWHLKPNGKLILETNI